jgi:diguanylate cyclase (GGDEF)-like protein
MHDEHTRLLRRAALVRRLSRLLRESGVREGHAFMYMDLDKFKAVNDSAGHAAGDLAIRQIAARFREVVRSGDSLARLGGDEFGLLLERCPAERARERAIQLNQAMAEYVLRWDGKSHQLGIRIGIALFKGRTPILRTILAAADTACYQAKRAGGEGGFGRSTLLEGRPLSVSNIVETSNT